MRRFFRKVVRLVAVRVLLAREWLDAGVSFNLVSSRLRRDPYPIYRKLREKDPVHRSRLFDGWVLSNHADVDAVLRDHQRFTNDVRNAVDDPSDGSRNEVHSILYLDPPDHTRLRSLVSKAFTRGAVEAMQPRIEQIVDDLLDQVGDAHRFDAMQALAYPLPVIVIAEMLGVPPEDRDRFKGWSNDVAAMVEPRMSRGERGRYQQSREALLEYFDAIVEERRADPRDDLVSALAAAEEDGAKLSHDELLVTLMLLLVAGNETTTNLIGNGLLALLQQPEQLAHLREDPNLIEPAIEEMLRFDSPVQIDSRTALEDLVVGGRSIKKGQQVILLIGAANRDPGVFPNPDSLDFGRDVGSHISFGRGIHHCLGAPLARIEGRIAFRKLLERFPHLRLAGRPKFRDRVVLHGLSSLPVAADGLAK